jgi:hypothetical protein
MIDDSYSLFTIIYSLLSIHCPQNCLQTSDKLFILCQTKSKTLKLAPLLADFLYNQKKMTLTGIGVFLLDSVSRGASGSSSVSEGISFEYNPSVGNDDSLISYISAKTGKMRALASSDLNSYLELARQFLNIGKPFQIEGVGTLVKMKSGHLDFTADHLLTDKVKEAGIKELSATSISDESLTTYESLKPQTEKTSGYRRLFLLLLAVATGGIIIWGGYRLYRNSNSDGVSTNPQDNEQTLPVTDSAKYVPRADSSAKTPASNAAGGQTYRFVIETADRRRAMYRYAMLRKGLVPIQIATDDSLHYKLFFLLPATPADTARISDSLSTWYPAMNRTRTHAER